MPIGSRPARERVDCNAMAEPAELSVGALLGRAARDWRRVWKQLLIADIAYKILEFAILAPLVGLALRLGVALSGNKVLADQDIMYFLLSPMGLVVLVAMSALFLALTALQQAGLMTIGLAAAERLQIDLIGALRFALRGAGPVVRLATRLIARCWRISTSITT